MILVQDFASIIHHLQRPNEFLVNFTPPPPRKSRENTHNFLPPNFFKRNHTADFLVWGGFPFRGRGNIPGVQIWRYQQRSGQARQERHGQLVGSGAGVGAGSGVELDGSWEWEYLPKIFTYIHGGKVPELGCFFFVYL